MNRHHRRRFRSSPRVRIQPVSGRTVLAGVSYQHLDRILTQAWLYCDEESRKRQHAPRCKCEVCADAAQSLQRIDAISGALKQAIADSHPKIERTGAQRKHDVTEERNQRMLIDSIIANCRSQRHGSED